MEKSTNKTAFILAMSGKSAAEVVAAGAKKGLVFTDAYVYSVRSKATKKGEKKPAAKRGRPKKTTFPRSLEPEGEPITKKPDIRRLVLDLGRDRVQELTNAMLVAAESQTGLTKKEEELVEQLSAMFSLSVSDAVNTI